MSIGKPSVFAHRVSFVGPNPMELDIGFGDAVTPPLIETAFPTILDGGQPRCSPIPGRRL